MNANHTELPMIAALASGGGRGAIAVIRVSGAGSHQALQPLLLGRFDSTKYRQMQLCQILDRPGGEVIDEPLVAYFKGPYSFTGEDSAEIFCHGGPYIVSKILSTLYQQGIRAAEPGEFTKRAFLNGKLDLTQAEGIKQLVDAHSAQQWQAARYFAEGHFSAYVQSLRQSLIAAMAYLEARIDFPDEGDTQDVGLEDVITRVETVKNQLDRLAASYDSGRVAKSGLNVAILGAPNMGKSTLMNTLLGQQRAIVTATPGTTRDYIEEACLVKGRLIRLVDTAGIRESDDDIEQMGIERARRLASEADYVLVLLGADQTSSQAIDEVRNLIAELGIDKCCPIITKSDLGEHPLTNDWLSISCQSESGIDKLRDLLAAKVDESVGELAEEPYITSSRHLAAVSNCRDYIKRFFEAYEQGHYDEILAFELQASARTLNELIGKIDSEDILDLVFGEFCIGK